MQSLLTTSAAGALAVSNTTKDRMQAIKDDVESALQRFKELRTKVGSDKAIEAGYDSRSLREVTEMTKNLQQIQADHSTVMNDIHKKQAALRQLKRAENAGSVSDDHEARRRAAAEVIRSLIEEPSQMYRLLEAVDLNPDNGIRLSIARALAAVRGCSISEIVAWLGEPELETAKLKDQAKELNQQLTKYRDQVEVLVKERDSINAAAEQARADATTAARTVAESTAAQEIAQANNTAQRARQDLLKVREDLMSKEDAMGRLRTDYSDELLRLRRTQGEEVRDLRQSHDQELGALRRGRDEEAQRLRQAHAEEVQRLQSELLTARQEAQRLRQTHAEELSGLQSEHNEAYQSGLSEAYQGYAEQLQSLSGELEVTVRALQEERSISGQLQDRALDAEEHVSDILEQNSRLQGRVTDLATHLQAMDEQIALEDSHNQANEREKDDLYESIGSLFQQGRDLQQTLDAQVQHASTLLKQLSIGTESDIWRTVARRALADPTQAQPDLSRPQPWKVLSSWATNDSMVIQSDDRSLQAQALDILAILKSRSMDTTSLLSRLSSMLSQLAHGSPIFVSIAEMLLDTFATVGSDSRLHLMHHVMIHQVAELLVGNDRHRARALDAVDSKARQLISSLEGWDSGSASAFDEDCVEHAGLAIMGFHRDPQGVLVLGLNDRHIWWVDGSRIERRFLSLALRPLVGEPILLPLDSEPRIKWAITHT
ncbi:uncharacterized protein NECHADRAFT_83309 [Fusarium vanettenii 77-13-4]|uniref:Uncharacterized protein n=1 Tax=Fusarium vanettenii (strain ATCC MYA-4622 / CBS 123669 / FGSC 9596 / NRRL 45880 / 77-13-4) TaxID=660122 RepID=C7Z3N2_FUSV7|nr:uncharacterized protein NECHADRAFT_83309 [Fusarium vanettenii 77-13-4]EEU41165.1 hypothetical protein NECHADRAFT_83309 [Fusarium vanettenii 77-13-4]